LQSVSVNSILSNFLDRLSAAPASVLMLDYDGTLAPFQVERDHAYPYPDVVSILGRIVQCQKTRVIVITGRPVVEMKTLLRPLDKLEVWGSHGMERLLPDRTFRQMEIDNETIAALSRAEEWVIAAGLRSRAEIKPGGIAVHWRGLPDFEIADIEDRVRRCWSAFAERPGLKVLKFEAGLELRVAHPDKGDAVAAILGDTEPTAEIAYLGDDLTDEDAFRALRGRGLSVLVRAEYRETNAEAWLRPPHELVGFLTQWLNRTKE
jgi:trehalose 6-phosphate phosphatase